MNIGDINECKTPSSIASSPREVDFEQGQVELGDQSKLANSSKSTSPQAFLLHDLWLSARYMRRDANGLHSVFKRVQSHLADLKDQLTYTKLELERQQQAANTIIMEKDCEIKMIHSEAEAYKLAAFARASALTALQMTLAAVQAENAAAHAELAKVKQLYSYEQSATQKNPSTSTQVTDTDNMTPNYNNNNYTIGIPCTSQPELLQQPTSPSSSTPSLQKYIAILTSKLETAQTDATTASERLIRACEENARLSDALATLELHVIDLEKGESNWKEREEDLKSQIKKVSSENSRLHGHLHAAKEELVQLKRLLDALQHKQHGNKSMIMTTNLMSMLEDNSVDDLDGGMLAAPETVVQIEEHQVDSHGQRSCALVAASAHAATAMAMSPTKLSSHAATVHQEDLLALELLHLRNKNNELETRLSASHGAVSVVEGLSREVSALHAENTALRSAVSQSNDDALKSRRELKQVQQEAQALHHQLSDVISSLTSQSSNGSAATALPSPVKRALQAVGSRNGIKCIQPAVTASTDDVISSPGMSNHGNVRSLAHQVVDHPKLSSEGGRPYSAAAVWNHRGPPTPTSDVALVHLGRGQTADSDSSSGDMMMSELKAAMAALDGRAEATVNRENDVHAADDTQLADVFCDV